MKISFQTQETEKQEAIRGVQQERTARGEKNTTRDRAQQAYSAAFFAGNENNWLQGAGNAQGNSKKSLVELQQEIGNIDAGVRQDYMTVMANTMSETDFSKLEEEGFDFGSMNPEEAVNIVDKIKAELARSGQHIVGYTDDMDMDTLAAAVGSDALARAISHSFERADIPMTAENLSEVKRAWDMASQLETSGDGADHYMIDNQAAPEIWNFYLAQNSGAAGKTNAAPRYYAEDIQGYFTRSAGNAFGVPDAEMQEGLQKQIDKIIGEAGLEGSDSARANAGWLLQQGLPLTADNLLRLQEIQSVSFPVTEEQFATAAAGAILAGKSPVHANLADSTNLYEKAAVLTEEFIRLAEALLDTGDITARRQLEEIRLRMTAEVNVKLLKSGFSIDTAPMEQFWEALKKVEAELAGSYFPKDENALEKYGLYRETTRIVNDLPGMPAQVLGSWSVRETDGTLAQFHGEGKALQDSFNKAQESYETLMTAPRADMGDSIRKAFANVDAILEDLGLDLSEENQRAVRILGYNRMEMTVENIELVRRTDEQVRSVIDRMTPAATLQMIRDGVNPLEMSFEELENYFDSQKPEYKENAENYSRFLYQLEQNREISPQEREAYIGIYRLIRQIEKNDDAAIGAVLNTGAELQFANLLAAVRSSRFRHMDVKVTDETGLMQELVRGDKSISEQITEGIAAAKEILTEVSSDEEIAAQYRRVELEMFRQTAAADGECYDLLAHSGLIANGDNLLAAKALLKDGANPYKKWKEKATENAEAALANGLDEVLDAEEADFVNKYQEGLQQLTTAVEQATLEAGSGMDVKELQLVHKQLTVMTAMSDAKEYILPMYIGDELGRVHLTLKKSEEEKGTITIKMDWSENSHAEARLEVSGRKVTGYLVGNTEAEVTKLQKAADIFHELLKEDTSAQWEQEELPVVSGVNASRATASKAEGQESASDTKELYRIAGMFLRAMKE